MKLSVKTEFRFPPLVKGETGRAYTVATGCYISGAAKNREAAKADLQNFMTPPDVRTIEHWLAELSVLTAGRGREGLDAELMVTAYTARLGSYPADVVRYALLGTTWKWFPAWAELEEICEVKAGPRRHMLAALSNPVHPPPPILRTPTQDERERIQELVDELFPAISQQLRDAALG